MKRSKNLIAFSGLDGAGKSTQIELLEKYLRAAGRKPVYLWSRGGYTRGFNALKSLLRKSGSNVVPASGRNEERQKALGRPMVRRLWLSLAIIDLMRVYGLQIRYWKMTGKTVICDRYLEDTAIDFQLNFPGEPFAESFLWKLLTWVTPQPDITFVLLIPVAESLKRSVQKDEPFPDSPEVLEQRLNHYKRLAEKHTWVVLDGQQSIDTVWEEIQQALDS